MNALQFWDDTDLCDDCTGFLTYGTLGDYSAREHTEAQKSADANHAALMRKNLGVIPVDFDSTADVDGSFSHWGCEGCGRRSCHVYTGTLAFEKETDE